jgi:hypothetical protein
MQLKKSHSFYAKSYLILCSNNQVDIFKMVTVLRLIYVSIFFMSIKVEAPFVPWLGQPIQAGCIDKV